jgi:hypothetical protein
MSSQFYLVCRQTGSYPETGLEEIKGDLLEADFWTTSRLAGRKPTIDLVSVFG